MLAMNPSFLTNSWNAVTSNVACTHCQGDANNSVFLLAQMILCIMMLLESCILSDKTPFLMLQQMMDCWYMNYWKLDFVQCHVAIIQRSSLTLLLEIFLNNSDISEAKGHLNQAEQCCILYHQSILSQAYNIATNSGT